MDWLKCIFENAKKKLARPNEKQLEATGRYFHMLSAASMSGFAALLSQAPLTAIALFILAVILFLIGLVFSRGGN